MSSRLGDDSLEVPEDRSHESASVEDRLLAPSSSDLPNEVAQAVSGGAVDTVDAESPATTGRSEAESTAVLAVLKRNCHSCHGEGGSDEGGFNYVVNLNKLVATGKIVPEDPSASPLLQRIVQGEMPPEGAGTRPDDADIETLTRWVRTGAPAEQSVMADRPFISPETIYKHISEDLQAAGARDRRFLRYFTITHLYNASLSDDELATIRLALRKLINSLSWEREFVHPRPIDDDATLFRIDLRDLRWSQTTWDGIIEESPYALVANDPLVATSAELSECRLPVVRADWFIAAASRPPLYHEILELPASIEDLETQLRIRLKQNVDQDRAVRAGFTLSGVSVNPRIIERHRTSDGACWISHDFASSTGRANIFRHPLEFQPDGGEVIFNLPNGLQAYLLVNAEGDRIDSAPTSIVKDPQQSDGAVINGVSCMRCHATGIIPKRDEVRATILANAGAFADQIEGVKAVYRSDDEFQELIRQDRDRFQSALKDLGIVRFSIEGEPVFNTSRRFHQALDLRQASAELGVPHDTLMDLIGNNQTIQVHLGALRVPGGMIQRGAFTEAFAVVVRELGGDSLKAAFPATPVSDEAIVGGGPPPKDLKQEFKLPEALGLVRTGGGGRFVVFQLPESSQLAIFDVALRKFVKHIPISDHGVLFAAGVDKLMILRPAQRLLERWSLATFERERVATIPRGAPFNMAWIGSNSDGPLMLWSDGPSTFWDISTLKPIEIDGPVIGGDARWEFTARVSADGQAFTGWNGGLGPTPFGVMRLNGAKSTLTKLGGFSHNGRWAQPTANGHLIITSVGADFDLWTHQGHRTGRKWEPHTVLLPCVDARFFLAVHESKEDRYTAICTTSNQRVVHKVRGVADMMTSSLPGRWANFRGEPRVSFVPSLNAFVTLPVPDRIVVRHLNLIDAMRQTGQNSLTLLSLPVTRAVAGEEYRYQIDARSNSGRLRYKLESAPNGMSVSSRGEVRWSVPANAHGSLFNVIVSIRDGESNELLHSFSVTVDE